MNKNTHKGACTAARAQTEYGTGCQKPDSQGNRNYKVVQNGNVGG